MTSISLQDDDINISKKRARSRTGCLPCRKKRKKCDEHKPSCARCLKSSSQCHWDAGLQFRQQNALTVAEFGRPRQSRQFVESEPQVASTSSPGDLETQSVAEDTVLIDGTDTNCDTAIDAPNAMYSQQEQQSTQNVADLPNQTDPSEYHHHPVTTSFQLQGHGSSSPHAYWDNQVNLQLPRFPGTENLAQQSPRFSRNFYQGVASDTSPSISADGIFEPGSRYEELHQTLRTQILQAAQSTPSSRRSSQQDIETTVPADTNNDNLESRTPPEITTDEELILWENWINEISTWLDKFSHEKYFQNVLPVLANEIPHLKYSMLALSARQLERKECSISPSMSLSLYHWAIHLLLPSLHMKDTSVLASCVILCVLEMFSCSPKAWRRHLDGCAGLIQSMDIHIDSGGLEGALFICFARMDVWGGLISSGRTLIPLDKWTSNMTFAEDARMYSLSNKFEDQASYICYLLARAINLINLDTIQEIQPQPWIDLFASLEEWYNSRPVPMRAVLSLPQPSASSSHPFPTTMFTNDAAISGNQIYHTACVLMLQRKPPRLKLPKSTKSMLWHARQICGISLSNRQRGALTNAVQPIYIAGKLMSSPSEHRAIFGLFERIERETGWGAAWRADELRELWGDLN